MRDGFIKVMAATPDIRVADCRHNTQAILALMRGAAEQGVRLLVLPELCVTGYTCGDLFLQGTLLQGALDALADIRAASAGLSLLTVAGLPLAMEGKLYNCAAVVLEGRILAVIPKQNIPGYGEFYEARHFTPGPLMPRTISLLDEEVPFGSRILMQCRQLPDFTLGVEICEDLWVPVSPSAALAASGATVIANLSASDEVIGKADYRRSLVSGQSARLLCAYLYADAGRGESTTDLVFSGHNLAAENGAVLAESAPFGPGQIITEVDVRKLQYERRRTTSFRAPGQGDVLVVPFALPLEDTTLTRTFPRHPFVPAGDQLDQRCRMILEMQQKGLEQRLRHTGCASAVLGVSGGLDSCLALLVAVGAMGAMGRPASDVLAVSMPCFGTTARTRGNAKALCEALGASFREIDITAAVQQHFRDIGHPGDLHDVTFENAQARERTQVLMDLANSAGGLVVGTGDLSELALGWATYNGDHMSMYGVNASVPKTLVRHIVGYAAKAAGDSPMGRVLADILDTPVSPELLPAQDGQISQRTEDLVGPYELHDFFLYYALRWGFGPGKIYRLAVESFRGAYDAPVIKQWLLVFYRRFFAQQFKRSCLPDGPKVGTVALSPRGDWRMPSDASAALWLAEVEAL